MQIVSACLARDLPVYRVTCESLRTHVAGAEIHVITRKEDFRRFRKECGSEVVLWDENALLPKMSLQQLKNVSLPFFPVGAGWYFQQFLKYAFEGVSNQDEYFLIWDADTVLLRPLAFFDPDGRAYYTRARENHRPYFQTFERLFGIPAMQEFSFISQHQMVHKRILRQMLGEIEERNPQALNWPWAVIDNLCGEGSNLFSEYETYGHYAKWKQPETMAFRDLDWTRNGVRIAGYPPNPAKLHRLSNQYHFAAFEAYYSLKNRICRTLRGISAKDEPDYFQ